MGKTPRVSHYPVSHLRTVPSSKRCTLILNMPIFPLACALGIPNPPQGRNDVIVAPSNRQMTHEYILVKTRSFKVPVQLQGAAPHWPQVSLAAVTCVQLLRLSFHNTLSSGVNYCLGKK